MLITIKPYTKFYQEQVVNHILNIQQNEFGVPVSLQDQPDLLQIRDFYQTNNGNFWLALYNNQVVGTIALVVYENNRAAIRKMFVSKDFRGKSYKIAQNLLATLLNWAIDKNLQSLALGTVEKLIAAQRFYEKNNFKRIEKANLPKKFPLMKVDTVFYKLDL